MNTTTSSSYRFPFIALTSLFFMWGFMTVVVDAFIPRLREVFELSYGQAGLVQVAWFAAYFLISIPGGILVSRLGYKKGIIGGLVIAGFGCLLFVPAAGTRLFAFFLLALFTLASGITVLQVAANPFVSVLGPEEGASSRLNLSQAFNSLGTTIGPIFSAAFLLSDRIQTSSELELMDEASRQAYYAAEASAVQGPFIWIAAVLIGLGFLFAFIKLPDILQTGAHRGFRSVLQDSKMKLGTIGILVYVGAEVAIGSYLINYFLSMNMQQAILASDGMRSIAAFVSEVFSGRSITDIDAKAVVGTFVIFYWGGAMIGRFVGSWLMQFLQPSKVLSVFALGSISLILITLLTSGFVAMWSALAIGLFNSIMFPTIFTLSIEDLGDKKPQGSGILCTAIVGGAIIPPLFGVLTDIGGFNLAFALPLICYFFILFFGWKLTQMHLQAS